MKILIVKLGAMGDVLRTTPLLSALQKKYPAAAIDWVVAESCREALEGNPNIHRLWIYSPETLGTLKKNSYDLTVNLDKDAEALDTLEAAVSTAKTGFGRNSDKKLCALDERSDYAYRLGIDDELKFRLNQKTYQQISFEQLGLTFNKEEYEFSLSDEDRAFAREKLVELGIQSQQQERPVVGLNTGAGDRFAGKKLPIESLIALSDLLTTKMNAQVLLLGGAAEIERNKEIQRRAKGPVFNTGSHSLKRFAAIVRECDAVLTGDTTAMHIAIAVKTPLVCYFGSTCASEIELYGRGQKIVTDIFCAPCYKPKCPYHEECMSQMDVSKFYEALSGVLAAKKVLSR